MREIRHDDIIIRHDLRPGDLGRVTEQHGLIYSHEYGFNVEFEGYVAEGLGKFGHSHDATRERLWMAELNDGLVGSVAIVDGGDQLAQLRWFYVHPNFRGHGLGLKLLTLALEFSMNVEYRGVYLWTVHILLDAARLYRGAGFELTENVTERHLWGRALREQRYDLRF